MRHFLPDNDFESEMRDDPDFRDGLRAVAEDVKRTADALARSVGAPWMARQGHATVEVGEDAEGVYVANTDHGGHLMEYGSRNNPPHAPLRQGARAAGLQVDEQQQ